MYAKKRIINRENAKEVYDKRAKRNERITKF